MDVNRIVSELDTEIARLQHIRSALLEAGGGSATANSGKGKRGRPKGSKNATTKGAASSAAAPAKTAAKKGKRVLSAEGRKRIQDAMKRRWAERRKQTAK